MKNKKLSWILLPVVLGIWGMIGWKIYEATSDEHVSDFETEKSEYNSPDTSLFPVEYTLVLNYRDPFLGDIQPARQPKTNAINTIPTQKKAAPEEDLSRTQMPAMNYYGLVKETSSNKMVGFLRVDSETFFVKMNDVIAGVKVVRLWSDSVEVVFGSTKTIIRK